MNLSPCAAAILCVAALFAQPAPKSDDEERDLQQALGEAGSSSVEYVRVLEQHLKKYPKSSHATEIRRVIVQSAIESRDKRRLLEYGVPLLDDGGQDPPMLDHVTRALLDKDDAASLKKSLVFSRRLETLLEGQVERLKSSTDSGRGVRIDEYEQRLSRSRIFQARALGGLGTFDEAITAARKAYATYSSAEAAREMGRWLERAGKTGEALASYAEAFGYPDQRSSDAQRARDRAKLSELSKKTPGGDAALGPLVLAGYDRAAAAADARRERLRAIDPNALATEPSEFVLSSLGGEQLPLASLKGSVVVMDFWATWCGPCRAQHPLYQQVEQKFKGEKDVVFLAINTDEDRSLVEPFLKAQKWNKSVYFEDGLSALLRVNSIPTTIILGRDGQLINRLNGFVPERFVDMLTSRIKDALASK